MTPAELNRYITQVTDAQVAAADPDHSIAVGEPLKAGWYFFDEIWDYCGPYPTRADAVTAFEAYVP